MHNIFKNEIYNLICTLFLILLRQNRQYLELKGWKTTCIFYYDSSKEQCWLNVHLLSSASLPPRSGRSVGEHHNTWLFFWRWRAKNKSQPNMVMSLGRFPRGMCRYRHCSVMDWTQIHMYIQIRDICTMEHTIVQELPVLVTFQNIHHTSIMNILIKA